MAKKNSRSTNSTSQTNPPTPERRRTVRATTRTDATSPDAPVADPSGSENVSRASADDRATTQVEGSDTPTPTFEEIAEAAYQRYLARGGEHGRDFDDWLDAERSLRSRS
jgi:hypothetical protein